MSLSIFGKRFSPPRPHLHEAGKPCGICNILDRRANSTLGKIGSALIKLGKSLGGR